MSYAVVSVPLLCATSAVSNAVTVYFVPTAGVNVALPSTLTDPITSITDVVFADVFDWPLYVPVAPVVTTQKILCPMASLVTVYLSAAVEQPLGSSSVVVNV